MEEVTFGQTNFIHQFLQTVRSEAFAK